MSIKILVGDVFEQLALLPAESVHCVVTSPPYWGLRDYGVDGQIGLEPTLAEHLDVMVRVFREVRRVLRKDGTCWVNYGDCYATSPNGRSAADTKAAGNDDRTFRDKPFSTVQGKLKPKDLCMVPNRLAIALQDDGWWVRSEIIWAKPNPMPESISDRPATSHEKIFLLTKSQRYFYDAEAVREEAQPSSVARWNQNIEDQKGSDRANGGAKTNGPMKAVGGPKKDKKRGSTPRHEGHIQHTKLDETPRGFGRSLRNVWNIAIAGFSGEYCRACSTYFQGPEKKLIKIEKIKDENNEVVETIRHCPCGATDKWLSHFATFPPSLVEPCIKAGTSERGVCPDCGVQWKREVSVSYHNDTTTDGRPAKGNHTRDGAEGSANVMASGERTRRISETNGWAPSCDCDTTKTVPATVLDPFGGAGTAALVANRLQRDCTIIELNPEYAEMARRRIEKDAGLFSAMEAAQ